MEISEYLEAPRSRSPLRYVGGSAVSLEDESECYAINNQIVNFGASISENEQIKSNLNEMIAKAHEIGCLKSIEKYSNSSDYLLNGNRRKYIDLIEFKPSDIVLEIGASMGQHTRFICQLCQHLEALEIVPEQAAFAKLWCEESGQNNVNISAGGLDGTLPYKSDSFDILVINYVLEWSANRSGQHPEDYHFHLLSECLRVLKPGGKMFLSTKNRYNISLLLGGFDEHLDFRFGSALPRWLGSWLGNLIKTTNPRGYLHSRIAIERLFTRVGFSDLKPYLFLPDAREPKIIESFDKAGIERISQKKYWQLSSRKEKLFSWFPFSVQRNIAPSHVYIAYKPRLS